MKIQNILAIKFKYRPKPLKKSYEDTLDPRFRLKFVLYFFLLLMIPILVLGAFYLSQSKKLIVENAKSVALENSSYICQSVDSYLEKLSHLTQITLTDKTLIHQIGELIRRSSEKKIPAETGSTIYLDDSTLNFPASQIDTDANLRSIYILYNNQIYKIYNKDNDNLSNNNLTKESWYRETLKNPGKPTVAGVDIRFLKDNTYKYVLSTSFYIRSFVDNNPAIFLFDFDYNTFSKMFSNKPKFNYIQSDLFIINDQNVIMYNKNPGLLTTKLTIPQDVPPFGTIETIKEGTDMYLTYFTSNISNWKVVNYILIEKLIRTFFFSPGFLLFSILVCFFTVYLFSLILSKKLLKPFKAITVAMSESSRNDFSVQKNSSNSYSDHGEGISNMDMLVHKIYSTQIQQKEAQLKSLQNQINPHFLYNTLESIRGAALYSGADTIAEMSKCLSLFFRYSISDNILVSLKDEIQHLDNYMAIQNFRHEDKFEVVYVIPEALYGYKILKLTLQPLVENAIKHGLEMRLEKGKITISAFHLDNVIKIQIKDNGTGIPEKKLAELKTLLSGDAYDKAYTGNNVTGVGVQNVNSRIKIYFGKKYGLSYSSSESGTTVEITIPIVEA